MGSWKGDLIWFYANGHRVIPQPSTGAPDGGVRGTGNSGTKGVFHEHNPDLGAMVRYGRVSRALALVEERHRQALELAYGDIGAAVTECSLRPGDRWKAVAPMAPSVTEHMPTKGRKQLAKLRKAQPLDERRRDASCGAVEVHRVQHLLTSVLGAPERAILAAVRAEASKILLDAEAAFAAAWVPPSRAEIAEAVEEREAAARRKAS